MNTQQLIKKLQSSNLFAECSCGGEFKLSDAVLFDGAKSFPTGALKVQNELNEELNLGLDLSTDDNIIDSILNIDNSLET